MSLTVSAFSRVCRCSRHSRGTVYTSLRVFSSSPAAKSFVERDIVLLRPKSDPSATPILTKPLTPEGKIQTHKGALSHRDIIGKDPRDIVLSSSGSEFRVHDVSLSDYVTMSKRLVTPIYPADANLIVSLFDLHLSPPSPADTPDDKPQFVFLEAGTGHGALTLHLSRAIHSANYAKPTKSEPRPFTSDEPTVQQEQNQVVEEDADAEHTPLIAWKAARRAVIHSIDVSPKFSKHARKVVRGFRHGMYADNVDFHVGDVSEWVKGEFLRRANDEIHVEPSADTPPSEQDSTPEHVVPTMRSPFLSHAFLDLPATHTHLSTVAKALRTDGVLVVFNPSITQIAECVQKIKQENLPLFMEQTLELGTNGTSGGREWDVRAVKPRATIKKEEVQPDSSSDGIQVGRDIEQSKSDAENNIWSLVCRPKVGERIVGGGFLGVFRKMKDRSV